ncbi:MAG: hypothetical protein ACHQ5A_09580, partial [Opitutales bacterium]
MPDLPLFRAAHQWVAATLILTLLALAGCETRASRERQYRRDAAMSAGIPKVSMHGSGTFFGGTLVAEATVSRGLHTELSSDDALEPEGHGAAVKMKDLSGSSRGDVGNMSNSNRGEGGGMHSSIAGSGAPEGMEGAGYGGSNGGMRGPEGGGSHLHQSSGDWTATDTEGGELVSESRLGSTAPPISLRLRLVNKGSEEISVAILDIDSELGNFVPDPENVVLYPGRSIELTPMVSRLGVVAAEIPLKLAFRSDKKTETQTVLL